MDRILKFAAVGTWGFIINTTVLIFGVRSGLRPSIAAPIGSELAIISNFILNNFWTFSDKSFTSWDVIPGKFLQFNLLSFSSPLIQFSFLRIGEAIFSLKRFKEPFVRYKLFGKIPLLPQIVRLPVISKIAPKFSIYFIVYLFANGVAMVVNFLIYSKVIWR